VRISIGKDRSDPQLSRMAVFQPRKIDRSGLWRAFDDNVSIYVHKQKELEAIERSYPAKHYVLIDDKLAILDAAKEVWRERVTTVFPKQGHYAFDEAILANHRPADITIARIDDLMKYAGAPKRPRPLAKLAP
jgi:hypothetical protein